MNIVVRILRGVCLYYKVDVLEIYSSRDDVCSEQDSVGLFEELLDDSLSPASFEFSVDSINVVFAVKV